MASSTNYHLPAIAAMAGVAIAASGYALTRTSADVKKRRRRIKSRIMKERDNKYITGLRNTGNSSAINSLLQALATLTFVRSYLTERVDDQDDDHVGVVEPKDPFILQSVAYALYTIVETLNSPLSKPNTIEPTEIVKVLLQKMNDTNHRDQPDAHELFQTLSQVLTCEEELQYKQNPPSLLDVGTVQQIANEMLSPSPCQTLDRFETASLSSMGTYGSMWSSYSVSTLGGQLRPRQPHPRNPFTGLTATKISCLKCGYTAPIRHSTFSSISLTVPHIASCTLQGCLETYTKADIMPDYRCRKCMLIATLEGLKKELAEKNKTEAENEDPSALDELKGKVQVLKDAIKYNVEAPLPGIPLQSPPGGSCTTKQTMLANPPKCLCLYMSRTTQDSSGKVVKNHCKASFPENLDLSPFTTTGFLNTNDPAAALSSASHSISPQQARTSRTSLVYLRNMAAGNRIVYGRSGLNIALISKDDEDHKPIQNALPSLSVPTSRSIPYRLHAVIVHHGDHGSGHYVTYRRKKLPTGQDVRQGIPNADSPQPAPLKFWRCSDEVIEEVDIDTVLKSEAYMLFYERDV